MLCRHVDTRLFSIPGPRAVVMMELAGNDYVVGIDAVQFFEEQLTSVCDALVLRVYRIIFAGLDMDFLGRPFGQMPVLLAKADYITKLHAICMQCGNIAHYSYRKDGNKVLVELGNGELYAPRCRSCYEKGGLLK